MKRIGSSGNSTFLRFKFVRHLSVSWMKELRSGGRRGGREADGDGGEEEDGGDDYFKQVVKGSCHGGIDVWEKLGFWEREREFKDCLLMRLRRWHIYIKRERVSGFTLPTQFRDYWFCIKTHLYYKVFRCRSSITLWRYIFVLHTFSFLLIFIQCFLPILIFVIL